jgi:hypothetical protein
LEARKKTCDVEDEISAPGPVDFVVSLDPHTHTNTPLTTHPLHIFRAFVIIGKLLFLHRLIFCKAFALFGTIPQAVTIMRREEVRGLFRDEKSEMETRWCNRLSP